MQMEAINFYLALLNLWVFVVSVKANFDITVRFYEYWNPTGLCAECGTNGIPVCCDDPLLTESCQNTGEFTCDTRFRYILRPFNASLETAPNDNFPFFTPSNTNLNHEVFRVGDGGFLALPNPNTFTSTTPWTGRIQLLVDADDRNNRNPAPNETEGIIDRFLVNLDQLQLGADLTEETNYTGIHNISQLSMSFRVKCSEKYFGQDCCKTVDGVYNCDSNGSIVCVEENRDPTTQCTNCSKNYYGPNCTTFCEAVDGVYNCDSNGNIVCVEETRDPHKSCTLLRPDPCLSDPCVNGATCTSDNKTGEYECTCAIGYMGMTCESKRLNAVLIGAVVGGTAAGILPIIIVVILVVLMATGLCKRMCKGRTKIPQNQGNVIESLGVDSPTQQRTPDNIELNQNTGYGVNSTQTGNVDTEVNQAYKIASRERDENRPEAYDYIYI